MEGKTVGKFQVGRKPIFDFYFMPFTKETPAKREDQIRSASQDLIDEINQITNTSNFIFTQKLEENYQKLKDLLQTPAEKKKTERQAKKAKNTQESLINAAIKYKLITPITKNHHIACKKLLNELSRRSAPVVPIDDNVLQLAKIGDYSMDWCYHLHCNRNRKNYGVKSAFISGIIKNKIYQSCQSSQIFQKEHYMNTIILE